MVFISDISNSFGTTSFSTTVSGLNPNTTYYVRATATNSAGTAYGSYVPFTTSPTGTQTCTDPSATNFGGPLPCIPPVQVYRSYCNKLQRSTSMYICRGTTSNCEHRYNKRYYPNECDCFRFNSIW